DEIVDPLPVVGHGMAPPVWHGSASHGAAFGARRLTPPPAMLPCSYSNARFKMPMPGPLPRSMAEQSEMSPSEKTKWRTDGVTVVRAGSLQTAMVGTGRATAFDFSGTGGQKTWVGTVTLQPNAKTSAHHHGRHEVAVYVVKGRSRIRWGDRLEF